MNKALLAGIATAALVTAGFAGAAEARCFRAGHHLTCTQHHRMHYSHKPHYRTWAAGHRYGYRHAYPYYRSSYPSYGYYGGYGAGYGSSYSGSSLGPRPSGTGHD
jgi:hypothetical protein